MMRTPTRTLRSYAPLVFVLALAGCATPHEKMMSAAVSGNETELAAALKESPDVNAPAKAPLESGLCAGSLTALHAAACHGHAGAVRVLMARGADADRPDAKGQLPLVQAAQAGSRDSARALLEGGAKPNSRDASGQTALIVAENAEVVRLLLAHKADPNLTNSGSETPLAHAAGKGNAAKVGLLLRAGARPNARSSGGQTPLVAAANAEIMRLLLGAKADANFTNAAGETPLLVAARSGNAEMVRLLLTAGARPDARGPGRRTPLMVASGADAARQLLAAKADIAARDEDGETPLTHAARRGSTAVVQLLIEGGADIEDKNRAGENALAAAQAGRDSQTVALVREAMLNRKLAEADRAAARGDHAGALAAYVAALPQMAEVGAARERDLRIRILRLAANMPNPPAVPDAAHEHVVRAEVYLKRGRGAAEVEQEIEQALKLAPWWAEGYFNKGLVQGSGNRYRDAIGTLELFIAGAPSHANVRLAREKIVEFKIAQEEVDKVNGLAGSWSASDGGRYHVTVQGDKLTLTDQQRGITINATVKTGGALEGSLQSKAYRGGDNCTIPGQNHPVAGNIDRDGRSITLSHAWSNYATRGHCVDMFGNVTFCCLLCSRVCSGVNISDTTTRNQRLMKY